MKILLLAQIWRLVNISVPLAYLMNIWVYGIDHVFPFTQHKIGLPYDLTSQSHLILTDFFSYFSNWPHQKKLAVNFSKDCKSLFKTGHKETCRLPILVISIRSRFLQPYCSEIFSCSKIVTS